jgi:hypothetical protein
MSRIAIFLVAMFVAFPPLAIADTNYSRTVELPPLQVSFEDLQATLNKVSSLVHDANKDSSNWQEEMQLRKGEQSVKISGHRLEPEGAKIPPSIDSLEYTGWVPRTGRHREISPITQVTISFHDYKRFISVEGQSPEQVDALISVLRDDLSKLPSPVKPFLRSGPEPTSQELSPGTNYSRTEALPPLRASFEDLQDMLNKVSSLVHEVNKDSSNWQEELQIQKGDQRIKMSGHRLEPEDAKIPSPIDWFQYTGRVPYTGRDRELSPITQVTINFRDYERSVSVDGRSPEQVDALISVLRDDLYKLSSPFGGLLWIKPFLKSPFLPILFLALIITLMWPIWVQTHSRILVKAAAICVLLNVALLVLPLVLPLDEILGGFLAVRGDASFSVRYGPQIAFWSLILSLLSFVVPIAITFLPSARISK